MKKLVICGFFLLVAGGSRAIDAAHEYAFDMWVLNVGPKFIMLSPHFPPAVSFDCGGRGLGVSALPANQGDTQLSLSCPPIWSSVIDGVVADGVFVSDRTDDPEVAFKVHRLLEEAAKGTQCYWNLTKGPSTPMRGEGLKEGSKAFFAACSARNQLF